MYSLPAIVPSTNRTIAKGQNTTISMSASGSGLSYIWQISGDAGSTWSNLAEGGSFWNVTSPNLYISNAQLAMNGFQFRCRISGYCPPDTVTNPAVLTVLPNIITSCQSISNCPGEVVVPVTVSDFIGVASFSMVLNLNPAVLSFTGYQNVDPSLNAGVFSANAIGSSVFLSWLNTPPATLPNDAVLFEMKFNAATGSTSLNWDIQTPGHCEYSHINGQVIFSSWNNGSANILQSPTITVQPVNAAIYSGGSAGFSISTYGTGIAYLWQLSSDNGATSSDLSNTSLYSGVESSYLSVNPTDLSFNGNKYRCRVSGTCTPDSYSTPATLTVTTAAVITNANSINNSCTGNLILPITVANCDNIGAISLTLNYDTTQLAFEGFQSANSGLSQGLLMVNRVFSQVKLTWISTLAANLGSGTLIEFRFRANSGILPT